MDASYKQNEMTIYKIAVQLEQLIKRECPARAEEWMNRLEDIQQQLQTRKFRMAVVGEFNRGKSSFINVLLGKRILPEDVLATTATINRVTYGEKPKAYVIFHDGSRSSEEIPVEELAAYVTKLTAESSANASQIKEAVLEYPTMLCYDDVDLIDTPGMNDVDDMNAVTVNQLDNIDLAVVAINAQYPYSETENRFVVKLLESKKVCQIIFVVTYIDMIRPREREKLMGFLRGRIPEKVLGELQKLYPPDDAIFWKYHSIFDDVHIFGVSSKDAMDALGENDMELFEQSGFLKLRNELPREILSSRSISMLENILAQLQEIIAAYQKNPRKNDIAAAQWNMLRSSMPNFRHDLDVLIDSQIEMMNKISLSAAMDQALSVFLRSLGAITELTPENVHQAMLPVMKEQYAKISQDLRTQKEAALSQFFDNNIPEFLTRFFVRFNTGLGKYPELERELSSEMEQLRGELQGPQLFRAIRDSADEIPFYWWDSPVEMVLKTEKNQSVLPEWKDMLRRSGVVCCAKNSRQLVEMASRTKQELCGRMDAFLDRVDKRFQNEKQENEKNGALIAALQALREECDTIYRRIRPSAS